MDMVAVNELRACVTKGWPPGDRATTRPGPTLPRRARPAVTHEGITSHREFNGVPALYARGGRDESAVIRQVVGGQGRPFATSPLVTHGAVQKPPPERCGNQASSIAELFVRYSAFTCCVGGNLRGLHYLWVRQVQAHVLDLFLTCRIPGGAVAAISLPFRHTPMLPEGETLALAAEIQRWFPSGGGRELGKCLASGAPDRGVHEVVDPGVTEPLSNPTHLLSLCGRRPRG
jgi:hypothetical protein